MNLSVGCHTPYVQPVMCPFVFFISLMYMSPRAHSPRSRPSLHTHTHNSSNRTLRQQLAALSMAQPPCLPTCRPAVACLVLATRPGGTPQHSGHAKQTASQVLSAHCIDQVQA